ncbi:MAG: peptidylprolyl isomerase [Planctomycetes bacterium]|nr:peptidylprolyl isomerase [Planctomycetota bacterium]
MPSIAAVVEERVCALPKGCSMSFLLAFLAACGAVSNPRPVDRPAAWTPPVAEKKDASAASTGGASAANTQGDATKPSAPGTSTPTAPASNASAPSPSAAPTASVSPAPTTSPGPQKPPTEPSTAPMRGATSGVPIANVAGKPIDVNELLAQWVHHKSAEALDELDHLVLTRLVAAEAGRLGVEPNAELVQKTYVDAVAETEKELQKRRPGMQLDAWVDQVLGLDPLGYRETMRADALNQVLAERVTRAFLLQSEHAVVRVIVVKTETDVKAVQEALAKGEAFEEVAKRLSADSSAKDGGRVPPVVRSDTAMSKLAFDTPIGQVSEPRYNQGAWLLAKVEARPTPLVGSWSAIREVVEASLKERGIQDLEFSQWRTAMLRRYQVDIAPFLRLAGEPVR